MEDQQLNSPSQIDRPSAEAIKNWLVAYLAELLEMETEEVDPATPFERYGLDSSAMIVLSGDLQAWLGYKLEPTLLYDYPTIDALAQHLEKSPKPKLKSDFWLFFLDISTR